MNYDVSHTGVNPTIEALAADGTTVLETDVLSVLAPISTPAGTNEGAFRGMTRSQGDIRFLRLGGDYLLTHSLEIGQVTPAQATPEPGTFGFMLGGLGLAFLGRSRSAP